MLHTYKQQTIQTENTFWDNQEKMPTNDCLLNRFLRRLHLFRWSPPIQSA